MSKRQIQSSLNKKVKELKNTLQELQSAIEKDSVPLEYGTSRFGIASHQERKILIDTEWIKLFYNPRSSNGKNFLKDHFDIPSNPFLEYDIMHQPQKIKVMSDIPEIYNKFSKSFDTTVVSRRGKWEVVNASGKDTNKLIDIFDLIREYLLKQVQSLDSNQEELTNKLSEIEGDLYELRQSTDRLLEHRIKRDKDATIFIVALVIVAVIIIGYFYVST